VVFFGFNCLGPPTFTLTAECFPTRIRSAGFGLVDGLAVSGGAVGVLAITSHARNRALEDRRENDLTG
jgi:hypothetical protein